MFKIIYNLPSQNMCVILCTTLAFTSSDLLETTKGQSEYKAEVLLT